jgi:amidase
MKALTPSQLPENLASLCSNPLSLMIIRSCLIAHLIFALGATGGLTGCSSLGRHSRTGTPDDAFIAYWPAPANSGRLRLAVKDLIDLKGTVTTAGSEYVSRNAQPAERDANCMEIARARNVQIVGKTNLSEFALSPSGFNRFFGTPKNPLNRRVNLIPGGSSSGSAIAVADGLADVSFGTDSAGSVRVPAACAGVVGLKTTFGLVPLRGVFPVEPRHLDTVGPLGKDIAHTVQGMDLLQKNFAQKYKAAVADKPSAKNIKIGRLYLDRTDPKIDRAIDDALRKAGFAVINLDADFKERWKQADQDGTAVAAAGAWISDGKYAAKPGVATRTKSVITLGKIAYDNSYQSALKRQAAWKSALRRVFRRVDFVAVPTLQHLPPKVPFFLGTPLFETEVLVLQNTAGVNFAGNPALAVPVPVEDKRVPLTSLQLVGPRFAEAELLNAGRLIEASRTKSAREAE